MAMHPSLMPEIGPDGLAREAPVIAYTEKIIAEEQLQVRRYIEENYSKIRDVEKELANLSMELKLTAGPKKAALELLRKKIEIATEKIRLAKQKEEQARKVWEAALKIVQDEEASKQKLCDDLNQLVQEGSSSQFSRLEELKRRLEALNPSRASPCDLPDTKQSPATVNAVMVPDITARPTGSPVSVSNSANGNVKELDGSPTAVQSPNGESRQKKKVAFAGRGRGNAVIPKGHTSGWTGAGFDS